MARSRLGEWKSDVAGLLEALSNCLQVVFDVVQEWIEQGVADKYTLEALKLQEFPNRMNANPYARFIYCTSKAQPKTRSKWAAVMQWVADHNAEDEPFAEFVRSHGGLNECAVYASLDRPVRKKHRNRR